MLVPVAILSWCGLNAWATALFVFAVVLDIFDGPLARIRKEESKEGEWLDAYADKVLVIGLFWLFWFWDSGGITIGPLAAITAAEVILVIGRPFKMKRGKSGRANNWGKAKMWYQSLAVVSITAGQECTVGATHNLLWIALGLGLLSLTFHIRDIFARSQ
jgi:phosphatidylglycerophosphate synthase